MKIPVESGGSCEELEGPHAKGDALPSRLGLTLFFSRSFHLKNGFNLEEPIENQDFKKLTLYLIPLNTSVAIFLFSWCFNIHQPTGVHVLSGMAQVSWAPNLRVATCRMTNCKRTRPCKASPWTCRCCEDWWPKVARSPFDWQFRPSPMEGKLGMEKMDVFLFCLPEINFILSHVGIETYCMM